MKQFFNKLKGFSFFDTFKHASTYFSGTILIQGLGVITLPVYTYFMTTAEYGIANVYVSYATIATVVLSLNLHSATRRYYYEDKENFADFLGSLLIAITVIFWSLAAVIYIFRTPISDLIKLPSETIPYMIVLMYTMLLTTIFGHVCVSQKKSRLKTITDISIHYLKFGLAVAFFFVVTEEMYMGKIIGELLAMVLAGLFIFFYILKRAKFNKFSWHYVRYALNYSIPLIPMVIGGYLLTAFDQWYINATINHETAGLYSFAYKLGMLMLGLSGALYNAVEPSYYKYLKANDTSKIATETISVTKILVLGSLFLMLFSKDLGTILSAKASFQKALEIVNPIIGAYIFFSIARLNNIGINYKKKNWYLTFIMLAASAVNIILNIYFIPLYGYEMAAYTTLASYIVMMFLSIFVTRFILKLPPLPLAKIFGLLAFEGLVIALFYGLSMDEWTFSFTSISIKVLIFGIFAVCLFYKTILKLVKK